MPRHVSDDTDDDDADAAREDTTAALTLHNKRTARMQRKEATRRQKREAMVALSKLPTELILESLRHVAPRDAFSFRAVNRRFHALVDAHAGVLGDAMVQRRYSLLAQCLPRPKRLADTPAPVQALLTAGARQKQLSIHKRPYQHIQAPDAHELCTCLTCILAWNNLGLVLDFAHWQAYLDAGEPLPVVARGTTPDWNTQLVARSARIARRAVDSPLWYARILEAHLDSTVRSIRRHAQNKGNQRPHVAMTPADADSGTDGFLSKPGPPSIEFPYQRDEYYMLEAYLPNRWWKKVEGRWVYSIAGHHERDLELVQRLASR
ncbi:hypothetical protein N0V83_004883 [Neocucurbitaria cava]|uniref:F-box domain-containing protein n=1 Tax=Neocucurbitaria cava TaxID=798079 RepID=A0A9W9CMM1_9PLEO|nr:hypothetical protein N0V83_004883 [Neocucurbitaria cava]